MVPSSPALRIVGSYLCLLAGTCLMTSLLTSCKKVSPLSREKYWFDTSFDSTYYCNMQLSQNYSPANERALIYVGTRMLRGIAKEARSKEELDRLTRASLAANEAIKTEYEENGPEQAEQNLRDHKEEIRERGWTQYLMHRKSQ